MRVLTALFLLLVIGCGQGAVTEDEFRSFVGKRVEDVVARLGPPDEHHPAENWYLWRDRVPDARTGKKHKQAIINYAGGSMRVTEARFYDP